MASKASMLTAGRLRQVLDYDQSSGVFRWRSRIATRAALGKVAGCSHDGYITIRIDGVKHLAHRLAWLHAHGAWPPDIIDHINGDRSDNRLVNLRAATVAQNQRNMKRNSVNSTGRKGVHWLPHRNKFRAAIKHKDKSYHLGEFDCPIQAQQAYADAARRLFGEFARME